MDGVLAVLMFLIVLAPFYLFKLWWWFWMFTGIAIIFGLFELVSFICTRKTLSQQFWKFREENKMKAFVVIFLLGTMWLMLLLHLLS